MISSVSFPSQISAVCPTILGLFIFCTSKPVVSRFSDLWENHSTSSFFFLLLTAIPTLSLPNAFIIQGVKQVKKTDLNARFLFLAPPSVQILEERLRARGTETEDSLKKRLDQAKKEMEYAESPGAHEKIVVNDVLDKAYEEVEGWIVDGGKFGS